MDIELPIRVRHYVGLKTRISTMGSYIIIAIGLAPEVTGADLILLLDWRQGLLTTLRSAPTRTYLMDFVVVSDDVLALVQGPGNALELCRLTSAPTPSLQTIRILELPPVLPDVRLVAAICKSERHTGTLDIHQQTRPPPRHPFSPSQDDALVLLTLSVRTYRSDFVANKTYTLATLASTLLSFAECRSPDKSGFVVPWDAWGPVSSRCFRGSSGISTGVVAAQRWIVHGAIRDFCPRRVRASSSIAQHSTLLADDMFTRDIESMLPYHEVSLVGNEGEIVYYDAIIDSDRIMFRIPESYGLEYTIRVHTVG